MSGSWQRLRSDPDTYKYELDQNDRRLNRVLSRDAPCTPCRIPQPGFAGGAGVSVDANRSLIDVESDLLSYGRKITKCPTAEYQPTCPAITDNKEGYPCGGGVVGGAKNSQPKLTHAPECSFNQIDSRLALPPCTLRSTGYDRWAPLCLDPQDESSWHFPGETNINYRMVLKDTYVPCIPTPLDQMAALPPGDGDAPCVPVTSGACGSFVGDLAPDRYTKPFPDWYQQKAQ